MKITVCPNCGYEPSEHWDPGHAPSVREVRRNFCVLSIEEARFAIAVAAGSVYAKERNSLGETVG